MASATGAAVLLDHLLTTLLDIIIERKRESTDCGFEQVRLGKLVSWLRGSVEKSSSVASPGNPASTSPSPCFDKRQMPTAEDGVLLGLVFFQERCIQVEICGQSP